MRGSGSTTHQGVVKLAVETKQAMKDNEDDTTFHNMLGHTSKGCVKKMNDLGKKLGCI